MSRLRCVMCVLVLSAAATRPVAAQAIDPAFRADIEKLLDLTGASALGAQMANNVASAMLDGMKRGQPELPDRLVTIVKEVIVEEFSKFFDSADFRTKQVEIYARHFTHADIRGLLDFYRSDLGKKALAELPKLFSEGAAIGQEWTEANMPRMLGVMQQRLKAEGVIP